MSDAVANAEPTVTGDQVPLTTAETPPNKDATEDAASKELTKDDGRDKSCCSCGCVCRWIIFIVTLPILIVFLALSLVLWIILIPLKCLCPCIAPCLQCLVDAVTWLLYLPIRFLRWVANRPEGENESMTAEEGKTNYGATEEEKK